MGSWWVSYKPIIALLGAQMCYAGMSIMSRVALDKGMNQFVFVAYKEAVATILIIPIACFLERNKRPAMTCAIFWQIFVLALCGIPLYQNFYLAGLSRTSSTFASSMLNTLPALIFVLATASGMEKVDMRSKNGQAKVVGTIVCVGGAMVMTLYQGPVLLTMLHGFKLNTWMVGALMLFGSSVFVSIWITFQTPVVRKYRAQLSLMAVMLLQGTVQSILVALLFEPKASAWRLKWDFELLAILYSGILCSGFALPVQMYCIRVKGPIVVAMFHPTTTIMIAIMEHFILHIKFHLGSLLGAILIIAGLYTVLWGKANDHCNTDNITDCCIEKKEPLLQDDA